MSRGFKLTPKRLANMTIGVMEAEKLQFINILYEYEGPVAFDESEMGRFHSNVELPVKSVRFLISLGNKTIDAYRELW